MVDESVVRQEPAAAPQDAVTAEPAAVPDVPAHPPELHHKPFIAFVITVLVVIAVLGMLPSAVSSMFMELREQAGYHVYDLFSGQEIGEESEVGSDTAFMNVTVTHLDEARRVASLTISGHRVCGVVCPEITGAFYSLGNDAARRRGLPPSATVIVPGGSGSYTHEIELPIQGTPQRYPFDDYRLMLGMTVSTTLPNGQAQLIESEAVARRTVSLTLEDLVARLNMRPPRPVDPEAVRSPSDPSEFMLVDELVWERPRYLRIITIMLVILISASGVFALGLRTLHELVLGIGGIILGIWGVRSVVVESPLPDVTLIDLVLAFVMLALMLALSIRAARYFYLRSGLKNWRRGIGGLRG